MSTQDTSRILIAGAGPLGLAAALALHRHGHQVTVFDARSADTAGRDTRTLALSHGSRELLELLHAWPASRATPIEHILVTQQGGGGQTRIEAAEQKLPALGYVLSASDLAAALRARAEAEGIPVRHEHRVVSARAEAGHIEVGLESPAGGLVSQGAQLLLRCEGRIPDGDATRQRDYDQHALICLATPASPHGHLAHERFTPRGPIALLPFGERYAVVWTVPAARAEALMQAPDSDWLTALNSALGGLAVLTSISDRAHHPLGLRMRREITSDRCVWLGNAAQTLHPVAGQGFNLALRDVWELAETLIAATDPGSAALLARYSRRRRLDREGAAGFTDLLVRSFSTELPLMTHLRGAGLIALDAFPPLRQFVAKRMIYGARAWP
ncbi:FAD-dependent monooxygenase [Uliginosibacterium paludis]|uniref:FAD-dependent monooxygenase n=1 Tax=Uliginosibacterium paludis TaxID=1615952 RepID=A0ABV2CM20_9RHOO